ncbi:MAG: cation:proton antiporter [Gammaproteobacteria bacterium]|nr:cation:proton antiporter [Gammaproteobacteria bacterium]
MPSSVPAEDLVGLTLLQLAVIVLAARAGGTLALRYGQAAAVGEILVGILLGPSGFGAVAPHSFHALFSPATNVPLTILAQLGLVLLMFQVGLEFEFSHLRDAAYRRMAFWVALVSLVLPFVLGFAFGLATADHLAPGVPPWATALFIGTALAITALPILGRILVDFGMTRCPVGVIAITAAAINDVAGWLMLAVITELVTAHFSLARFAVRLVLIAAFALVWLFLLRPLMRRGIRRLQSSGEDLSPSLLGLVLALVFLSGAITYRLGIFAIFGGFLMGVVLHQEERFVRAWRAQIGPLVAVLFLPVFFTYTGLRTQVEGLNSLPLWIDCLVLAVLATVGKWGGAYGAARLTGLDHPEAGILGALMNTRALMELIVTNVGYDLRAITAPVFTMLVLIAVFSTVITSPFLRRLRRRAHPPMVGLPVIARESGQVPRP